MSLPRHLDVVLSGSGVNFSVHVGALYALSDLGIEIGHVVGVSGGAIVGSLFSLNPLPELVRKALALELSELVYPKFALFSLFGGSLYNCRGLEKFLQKELGNLTFSELPRPLTVLASDVEQAKAVVFSSAPHVHNAPSDKVYDGVRASMAAPVIFPPHLGLYDGGLVNNIPIDFAVENRLVDSENVIAIKVVPPRRLSSKEQRSLSARLTPKLFRVLGATINTLLTALDREHVEENTDKIVFVTCPNSSFDFDIPTVLRLYHYHLGYVKTLRHLQSRYDVDLSDRIRAAEDRLEEAHRRYRNYQRLHYPTFEDDPYH